MNVSVKMYNSLIKSSFIKKVEDIYTEFRRIKPAKIKFALCQPVVVNLWLLFDFAILTIQCEQW
jgi:hypothetical protein